MDTSKQGFSSFLMHFYNLLTASLMTFGEDTECTWYFLNYAVDIPLIPLFSYMILWRVEDLLHRNSIHMKTGYYGEDES